MNQNPTPKRANHRVLKDNGLTHVLTEGDRIADHEFQNMSVTEQSALRNFAEMSDTEVLNWMSEACASEGGTMIPEYGTAALDLKSRIRHSETIKKPPKSHNSLKSYTPEVDGSNATDVLNRVSLSAAKTPGGLEKLDEELDNVMMRQVASKKPTMGAKP